MINIHTSFSGTYHVKNQAFKGRSNCAPRISRVLKFGPENAVSIGLKLQLQQQKCLRDRKHWISSPRWCFMVPEVPWLSIKNLCAFVCPAASPLHPFPEVWMSTKEVFSKEMMPRAVHTDEISPFWPVSSTDRELGCVRCDVKQRQRFCPRDEGLPWVDAAGLQCFVI